MRPALCRGRRTEAVTAQLIAPGTEYLKRWNQLDINVKRSIGAGRLEFQPTLEICNLFNSSVVLNEIQTFGPSLGLPTQTLQGRFLKLSAMVTF